MSKLAEYTGAIIRCAGPECGIVAGATVDCQAIGTSIGPGLCEVTDCPSP